MAGFVVAAADRPSFADHLFLLIRFLLLILLRLRLVLLLILLLVLLLILLLLLLFQQFIQFFSLVSLG